MSDWKEFAADQAYTTEQIRQRLAEELPHWYHEDGWIKRRYRTHGWKGTLMVVNAIGHLSEAAFHHPDLSVSYALVVVKLMTHSSKGVTNKDFSLAKKFEQVIQWQPGEEAEGLDGIPAEARFAYIKYD
ncbi:MAG: 4a-hydroxytetrahydrobiopterin dehydratase [Gammaproteobacteria bacterium]|nr:4a-hydroxytetrahydrobiopterin dehydratase [Gammaproteobacteria bacterium]